MRRLYITNIRPSISYACPAWFFDNGKFCISKRKIKKLHSLQHRSLVVVGGSYMRTNHEFLEKELFIDNIAVHLRHRGLAHRARQYHSPSSKLLRDQRASIIGEATTSSGIPRPFKHPYDKLDEDAFDLHNRAVSSLPVRDNSSMDSSSSVCNKSSTDSWNDKRLIKAIKEISAKDAFKDSSRLWDLFRRQWKADKKPICAALLEEWGEESLEYYLPLTRLQSTMLIQLRTEKIGLQAFLYSVGVGFP